MKRMQNSSVGFRDQRMDVHLKTTKILTSFLILYAATFAAEISMIFSPSPWTTVISNIVWNALRIQSVLLVLASTACLWFAACLSVFYCAKIATFTHRYFLLVKLRITEMIPMILVGSVLVSLVSCLPSIWVDYNIPLCNSTGNHLKNIIVENQVGDISYLKAFYICLTWAVLPFLLFVASSTLLIASLWRHTRQMRQSTMSLKDPRTEAHIAALNLFPNTLHLHFCS
ncbi:hypothetical protein Chor_010439 [Crotalus horridus]